MDGSEARNNLGRQVFRKRLCTFIGQMALIDSGSSARQIRRLKCKDVLLDRYVRRKRGGTLIR